MQWYKNKQVYSSCLCILRGNSLSDIQFVFVATEEVRELTFEKHGFVMGFSLRSHFTVIFSISFENFLFYFSFLFLRC